jgi:hypothetical protein
MMAPFHIVIKQPSYNLSAMWFPPLNKPPNVLKIWWSQRQFNHYLVTNMHHQMQTINDIIELHNASW